MVSEWSAVCLRRLAALAAGILLFGFSANGQAVCYFDTPSMDSVKVSFATPAKLNIGTTTLFGVDFSTVDMDGYDLWADIGCPSLPVLRKWIEIPVCGRVEVEVTNAESRLLDGDSLGVAMPLAPRQPSVCKTGSRNADSLFFNRGLYAIDTFLGPQPAEVEVVGIARDRRLAQLVFSPVQYNPVANQFVVYTRLELTVRYHDVDADATKRLKTHSTPAFASYSWCEGTWSAKSPAATAPIRYLIVSHPMFRGYLDEFADWKRNTGYLVDIAYTDQPEVGATANSIKAFIKRQYSDATSEIPAPAFLLLVGDTAQLPAFSYAYNMSYYGFIDHVSDVNYACWTDDRLPDCHYGRLSAQNIDQLLPQLEKILMYERYEFPDPSFLDRAVLVAGVDMGSPGDYGYCFADPAMDYAAKMYVNGFNGFSQVKEFKNNTDIDPHVPNVTVGPNKSDYSAYIRSLYSAGAGWINYSAHGEWNRWQSPQMNNTHVAEMTNTDKCGVMIGNCCLTAKFDEPVCFAEALMRADGRRGAALYIGASNSTYWNEDFYWAVGMRTGISGGMEQRYNAAHRGAYDHIFHTHGEDYPQWAVTAGDLMMCGNMSVENSSSDLKSYYWQVYHLFGDPSMIPWLSQAHEMPLSYNGAGDGSKRLYVGAAPYAYVALTDGANNLLGAAFADCEGHATVTCGSPIELGSARLSAIAQGYKPAFVAVDQPAYAAIAQPAAAVSRNPLIDVYPSPTTGVVYLTSAEGTEVRIYSSAGKLVATCNIASGSNRIDISHLPAGVYILKTATASRKILKY